MNKQVKAIVAALAAFGSTMVAVMVGGGSPADLETAGVALMVAFVTWLATWLSPKNSA